MNKRERALLALVSEMKRRQVAYRILNDLFPEQKVVADCPSKNIAIRCSRRAGKSWTILAIMCAVCILNPKSSCLYLALTFDNVKQIVFKTIKKINDRYKLNLKINRATLEITFPNGSTIDCKGADRSILDAEKFAGTYYDIVAIDESASFSPETLDYLIDDVLEQTLIDTNGRLILAGSPRPVESGRFFDVATDHGKHRELWSGQVGEYAVFSWDTSANKYVAKQFEKKKKEKIEINPNVATTSAYLRNYLGHWATDIGDRVYKITEENVIDAPPTPYAPRYICGIDFGWRDSTAFCVGLINKHEKIFYILESYKSPEMMIDDIVEKIRHYSAKYPNIIFYGDTNEKIVCAEIAKRDKVYIHPAEKTNKYGHDGWVEIFNNDALNHKIQIVRNTNQDLLEDIRKLVWTSKRNGERIPDPNAEDHIQDGMLYAYRASYHYLEKPYVDMTEQEKIYQEQVKKAKRRQLGHNPYEKRYK